MPTYQTTRGFAILAIIAFIVDKTDGKMASCCTEVSRQEVTGPITGYRIQKWNPPCVKAVIFETAAGMVCSHWKEPWVLQKIRQFERARRTVPTSTTSVPVFTTEGAVADSAVQLTTSGQPFTGSNQSTLSPDQSSVRPDHSTDSPNQFSSQPPAK